MPLALGLSPRKHAGSRASGASGASGAFVPTLNKKREERGMRASSLVPGCLCAVFVALLPST